MNKIEKKYKPLTGAVKRPVDPFNPPP